MTNTEGRAENLTEKRAGEKRREEREGRRRKKISGREDEN